MPPILLIFSGLRRRHVLPVAIGLLALLAGACRSGPSAADLAAAKANAMKEGDERFARQQFAEAVAAYQRAVNADRADGEARLKLARAHYGASHWDRAAMEALAASRLLPGNREADLFALASLVSLGNFEDAAVRAADALKARPGDADLLIVFGNAKAQLLTPTFALAKFEEAWRLGRDIKGVPINTRPITTEAGDRAARDAFRRALEIDPKSDEGRLSFAGFLWIVGSFEEGAALLQSVAEDYPAHAFLSRALGLYFASTGREANGERYLKAAASSNDRDSQLTLADYYVSKGRDAEALPILESLSAAGDAGNVAAFRAAAIELRTGQPERALQRAEKALAADPGQPQALRIKAQALLAAKRFDEALKFANETVRSAPRSSDARTVLARCLEATGDPSGAFEQFAEAFRLDPGNAELPKELAELALVLNRDAVALEFARQNHKLHPGRDSSLLLVKALIRMRDFSEAERALAPLVTRDASSAEQLLLQAAIQAGRGNRAAARATYQHALAANADSLEALAGLVALDLADKQIPVARQRIDRALAARPNDTQYLLLAVQVAMAEGNVPRTEMLLRKVLDAEPSNIDAVIGLADAQWRLGKRDEAMQTIQQGMARRPASMDLQMAEARLLVDSGQADEARARYEAILSRDPNAFAAAARLAVLYADMGNEKLDTALTLATGAKRQLRSDPFVSDALGWIYVRRGVPTLAIPNLEEAVKAEPANAMFRYHLGLAYQLANQEAKARAEFTRVLTLDPAFPRAAAVRSALSALEK